MASRSSSPSPGQSGQDDRDDDADSASGHPLPQRLDESLDSDSEAVANQLSNRDDDNEEDGEIGNSSNVSRSDVSSAPIYNEAQPGSSSSSSSTQRVGSVSGSFQVMMMADDDLDDEDDEEAKAIAESRHMFAASSSSSTNALRHSPYLSSTTSRGDESVDMATFSPQPSSSSSGHNQNYRLIPTTSSSISSMATSFNNDQAIAQQHAASTSRPSTSKMGISSSSNSNSHILSSSADVRHQSPKEANNLSDSVSQSQAQPRVVASVNMHGEISNPPSPLGGRAANTSNNVQQRPDSPQAGPSGLKRHHEAMSDPSSSASSSSASGSGAAEAKQRRQSYDSQPGPSGLQPRLGPMPTPRQPPAGGSQPMTFMAMAKALAGRSGAAQPAPQRPIQQHQQVLPQVAPPPRVAPAPAHQPPPSNLNVASSSEAVPIDNGDSDDDEYAIQHHDDDSNLVPPHTPADNYLISSSTGVNDSIPPTPVDVHGDGDLSVPSPNPVLRPPRQHHLDVDDMIDSTVDSSGYSYNTRSRSSGPGEAAALQNDEGPVQSSHYEDSSDDEVNEVNVRPQYHRHNSNNVESGISTSGQVDEGQFRLVPNNLEDERFNQFNPPRSQPEPSASSSTTSTSSTSRASASQNNSNEASVVMAPSASNSNANANAVAAAASAALFCEPGPSRPRNNGLAQPSPGNSGLAGPSGSGNNNGASNSRNNGLDYEIDARQDLVHFPLDNFPDPASGDYDPTLSSSFPPMDSHPVDLEDIQVQNFAPVVNSEAGAEPSASVSSASMSKYINNNDMKDDLAASGSLGNISLAFSGLPGSKSSTSSSAASANDSAEAKAASSSTSNNSYHSSILESMTGPLSKRLRTLHSLQQQQSTSSGSASGMAPPPPSASESEAPRAGPSSYKVNGEGKKSKNNNEAEAAASKKSTNSTASASGSSNNSTKAAAGSSSARQHFDPEQDDDGSAASGSSGSNVIQTFSVTIETIGGGNAIKPKKFFQQKSANDELFDVIHPLNDEKSNSLALNRTRRKIKKKELIYCEQCRMDYDSECPLHQPVLMHIADQSIMTRAQASLPSGYLALRNTDTHTGIYAKKTIPKTCRFGPVEGRKIYVTNEQDLITFDDDFVLTILEEDGNVVKLDTADEDECNWMRFVRPADRFSEQNLILSQENGQLYFTSTRNINPRQELRVGYSPSYSEARGLRPLQPSSEEIHQGALDDNINSWPCFECSRGFPSSDELQIHLNEHENIAPNSINGSTSGNQHKRLKVIFPQKDANNTNKIRYKCPICPRIFDRQYSLQRHIALHKGDKKFKCDECSARYSLKFNLNRHKRRAHNRDPKGKHTRCATCGLWFEVTATYRVHTYSHHPPNFRQVITEDDLKCPQCEEIFVNWPDHVTHSTTHGLRTLPNASMPQAISMSDDALDVTSGAPTLRSSSSSSTNLKKPHKCELCYKSFSSEERLKKHMAVHGSDESKPLACPECGKRFLSNSALACHLKVHATEMFSYDCPICSQPFDQIHALKEHVHIHRINNVYTCPHCLKEFPEYALIRKHIRAFHAAKRFQCPYCEKAFTGSDKLKAHMVKHSDKREFLCNECGKTFKRKDKLKEHTKKIHSLQRKTSSISPASAATLASTARPEVVSEAVPLPVTNGVSAPVTPPNNEKFTPRVSPTDYHRFVYKCHKCLLGFKRRGMLVNHLAKRHPDIALDSVPELNMPILKATKDYFCQYCNKVYKSSSKRKSHILKNHPGKEPPPSARDKSVLQAMGKNNSDNHQDFNPTFSTTVGSVTSQPHNCRYCHKQYATNAKLLQHLRKDHKASQVVVASAASTAPQQQQYVTNELGQLVQGHNGMKLESSEKWPTVESVDVPPGEDLLASAGLPPEAQPPPGSNIAYRIEGEVLQLTRVPQDEAMRLVNSGATVIHVDEAAIPGPSSGRNGGPAGVASHLQPQPLQPSQPRGLNSYDLPAELVQVLVAPDDPTLVGAGTSSSSTSSSASAQQSRTTTSNAHHPDPTAPPPPPSTSSDWINAYRR